MHFQLTPRSMILDDLDCYKLELSWNFKNSRDFADLGANYNG